MPDDIDKARKGKIGRLPYAIRAEVCRRMHDGETGGRIAKWLNELPEVLRVLDEYFNEEPVSVQNLSEWRKGGFQDWLRKQESIEHTKELASYALKLGEAAAGSISDGSAAILGGRIMAAIEGTEGYTSDQVEAVTLLRKGDHERLKRQQAGELLRMKSIDQDQNAQKLDLDKKRFQRQTCELFLKWAADDRAKKVIDSRDSNSDKIEQLGQVMFGEDW
jgi:hypothetical protein